MVEARATKPKAATMPRSPNVDELSPPAPVYLLFGDEYLVGRNARKLVDRICPPEQQAFGLDIVDPQGDTLAEVARFFSNALESLRTVGFLGQGKVIWLRDVVFLNTPRTMKSEDVKHSLDSIVQEIKRGFDIGTVLVISARGLDKRSALFRACDAVGHVLEYAIPDKAYLVEQQAQSWVQQLLQEQGLSASREVQDRLIGKAGTDTRQLAQEVEKIRLYLGDRNEVFPDDIFTVVSPAREASSWDLEDAMGDKNLPMALSMLRQLLFQGENPVGIVIRLEKRYRELMIFYSCLRREWCRLQPVRQMFKVQWSDRPEANDTLSRLQPDPRSYNIFRAGRLAAQSQNYSGQELLGAQDVLNAAHEDMVRSTLPKSLILEFLIIRLLGR